MRDQRAWQLLTPAEKIERLHDDLSDFIAHSDEQVRKRNEAFEELRGRLDALEKAAARKTGSQPGNPEPTA